MKTFLYLNIIVTGLNIFIIIYAYSLNFFPKRWRKKVNQDTLVGLALIFFSLFTFFLWAIYFYYKIFISKQICLAPLLHTTLTKFFS